MDIRIDRLGALIDQFDSAVGIGMKRMDGLADAEYLWEPASGMWSVRPVGKSASSNPIGPGAWQIDNTLPTVPPDPPPLTTIAWRIGHLTTGMAGRWEHTFGARKADPASLVDFASTADAAIAGLEMWFGRWRQGLSGLTDEQLEMTGFGQYPWGLDPGLPFIGIIWWVNREIIHHLAEAALLRDLYAAVRGESLADVQ